MPRHFTEKEKIELKKNLLNCAKDLFIQYGLNKTTITDITEAAGVGKGTFYLFFNSKGDIFLQLYSKEWIEAHEIIDANYLNRTGDIDQIILDYIYENREVLTGHPILSIIYTRNALSIISEPTVNKELHAFKELSDARLITLIKSWFATNHIESSISPEIMSGMMRSLSYLNYHKDEIGEEIFYDVIKRFAEGIASIVNK